MTVRHPGISPTNDLVAKKIFSNPEITCQFIRDMLDLPAKNVTILEGSNIHVLPSLPYSAQDFYTSIDAVSYTHLDVYKRQGRHKPWSIDILDAAYDEKSCGQQSTCIPS